MSVWAPFRGFVEARFQSEEPRQIFLNHRLASDAEGSSYRERSVLLPHGVQGITSIIATQRLQCSCVLVMTCFLPKGLSYYYCLDLKSAQNNGPYTAHTLCFGILGHYFGHFCRCR